MRLSGLLVFGTLALAGCATATAVVATRPSDAVWQALDSQDLIDSLASELRSTGTVRLPGPPLTGSQRPVDYARGYVDETVTDATVRICVLRIERVSQRMPTAPRGETPAVIGPFVSVATIYLLNVDTNAVVVNLKAVAGRFGGGPQGASPVVPRAIELRAARGREGILARQRPLAPARETQLVLRDDASAIRTAGIIRELVARCQR